MFLVFLAVCTLGGFGLGTVYSSAVIGKVKSLEARVKAMESTVAAHAEALKKAL